MGQYLVDLDLVLGGDGSDQSSTVGTEVVRLCGEETGIRKRGVV